MEKTINTNVILPKCNPTERIPGNSSVLTQRLDQAHSLTRCMERGGMPVKGHYTKTRLRLPAFDERQDTNSFFLSPKNNQICGVSPLIKRMFSRISRPTASTSLFFSELPLEMEEEKTSVSGPRIQQSTKSNLNGLPHALPPLCKLGTPRNTENKDSYQKLQKAIMSNSRMIMRTSNLLESSSFNNISQISPSVNLQTIQNTFKKQINNSIGDKMSKVKTVGTISVAGTSPTKPNQDSFFAFKEYQGSACVSLFGVMDGHGKYGHKVSEFVRINLPKNLELSENCALQLHHGSRLLSSLSTAKLLEQQKESFRKKSNIYDTFIEAFKRTTIF